MDTRDSESGLYVELAAGIVAAYVSNNTIPLDEMNSLIGSVHAALLALTRKADEPAAASSKPAVPIKRSVSPDYIICLEDGKRFKSLKRHLRTHYAMTPDEYRRKWSLAPDYPMVAPNYAQARSNLAKVMGLGQLRRRSEAAAE